jgi:hypothetical protein
MEEKPQDVLFAVHLIPDLAQRDFEKLVQLVQRQGA